MEEFTIKRYNVLLSAPSDIAQYLDNVKNAIEKFNRELMYDCGICFSTKYWKNDTFPDAGKSAQDIINEQIVKNSDIVIALFGAKLGTPTPKYVSGTIEEISQIADMGGKAMTYFATGKLVDIKNIDPKQLKKVQNFKKNYLGLYNEFETVEQLENSVYTSLKNLVVALKKDDGAVLKLKSYTDEELFDNLTYSEHHYLGSTFFFKQEGEILNLINKISLIKVINIKEALSKISNARNDKLKKVDMFSILNPPANSSIVDFFTGTPVNLDKEQLIIENYCREKNITLEDDFFEIGGANYQKVLSCNQLKGTEDEEKKVRLIFKLSEKIEFYNGCYEFLKQFDGKYGLVLVLDNSGELFCEDIDLQLRFKKKDFLPLTDMVFQDKESGEFLKDFVDIYLKPKETTDIESMCEGDEHYPSFISTPFPTLHGTEYTEPDLDHFNEYLQTDIKNIYPYIINQKGEDIVLKLHINDLKQFTSCFVCGALMFNKQLEKLEYVITTKSLRRQIKGALEDKA